MLKKHRIGVSGDDGGRRLDHILADRLPERIGRQVSRGQVRKLIGAGAVYLNGKRVKISSKLLREGAEIMVALDEERLFSRRTDTDTAAPLGPEDIVYENEGLLVVNKPAGLPTQPTLDGARKNLFDEIKRVLKERDGGDPYVGLHHRLDRDTSGLVLFTTEKEMNTGVSVLFRDKKIRKTYEAVSRWTGRGDPPRDGEGWKVEDFLGEVRGSRPRRFRSVRSGGKPAQTDFEILERRGAFLRIAARPRTGRTHQIRVHLSEWGAPILGDFLYGKKGDGAARMMLHAAELRFVHPKTGAEVTVRAEPPEEFASAWRALR